MSNADLQPVLAQLRALARRHSRVPDDADDLLHDALLEAVRAGRGDLTQAVNYRWIAGTLRNLGAMTARGAVRRRLRESRWAVDGVPSPERASTHTLREWLSHPAVVSLPPSLRDVARLALAGHDRREIAWLLRLSETAMRQRISSLKRKLAATALDAGSGPEDDLGLPLGLIRRALLPVVVATQSAGAHDPDGHLLVLSHTGAHRSPPTDHPVIMSHTAAHELPVGGNRSAHVVDPDPDPLEPSA